MTTTAKWQLKHYIKARNVRSALLEAGFGEAEITQLRRFLLPDGDDQLSDKDFAKTQSWLQARGQTAESTISAFLALEIGSDRQLYAALQQGQPGGRP